MQITKPEIIIAIDPDIDKNGFAKIDLRNMTLTHEQLDLFQTIRAINESLSGHVPTLYIVEAGWHNKKACWHLSYNDTKQAASKKGYDVGRNHQVGIILYDYIKRRVDEDNSGRLQCIDQTPLRKCWKGKDGKITKAELAAILHNAGLGVLKSCNQEERDAILLAITHSNLPIRL